MQRKTTYKKRPRKPKKSLAERVVEAAAVIAALEHAPDSLELDTDTACIFYGGARPFDKATLYRHIAAGRYPAPLHVSPNVSRFRLGDCRKAKKASEARMKEAAE